MNVVCAAKLVGAFTGWSGHTLFSFSNGQHWVKCKYAYHYHYAYRPNAQIICENGRYYFKLESDSKSVPVKRTSNVIQSTINGVFNGWSGHTQFELVNGQIWEQSEYAYSYHYAYRPQVTIYNDGYGYRLSVDGVSDSISVRRIH